MNRFTTQSDSVMAAHKSGLSRLMANIILFQLGWFTCVWGAAHEMAWAGTVIAALIVALHLMCTARPGEELKLVVVAIFIGTVLDSVVLATGILQFRSGTFISGVAPHWVLALWALFATTLNVSLSWLHGRWMLAMLLGAIAGPLSYWGGVKLGAVAFLQPQPAVMELTIEWALAMPLLMFLAKRFSGVHYRSTKSGAWHV